MLFMKTNFISIFDTMQEMEFPLSVFQWERFPIGSTDSQMYFEADMCIKEGEKVIQNKYTIKPYQITKVYVMLSTGRS